MSKKIKNIYIGVAWPYVNEIFHIGNLAGAYLPSDIFARFHKLQGNKVLMVSGSDFHGTPITIRAEEERKNPKEIAEQFHKLDKKYLKEFDIEYTFYTSTHTKNHQKVVQEVFLKLLKNNFIKSLKTEQLYSEKSRKFLQDRYIEGECPYCFYKEARGDQCEKCGRILDSLELINPISKLDKTNLIKKETENYFLDLEKLTKETEIWLKTKKGIFRHWVLKESLGWIKEGLKPRAITRDLDWGVPLPISKIPKNLIIKNIKNKVFYVWFEAVIGYLSAAIEYSKKIKKPIYWREFFYNSKAEKYYFLGQDNLIFHTINWPAQLMGYDKKINLPTNVFVNKFLLLESKKMSKSRNWLIKTPYFVKKYPVDALRFYLALNMSEQKELNFTWRDFIETNNSILVGIIGNFIHRFLILIQKNFGKNFEIHSKNFSPEIKKILIKTFKDTSFHLEKGEFRFASQKIVKLAMFGNQYLDKNQLWKLVKENPKKAQNIILNCLGIIDSLRVFLYPFVPKSAKKLNEFLGYKKEIDLKEGIIQWQLSKEKKIINLSSKITPIFLKIEEKNIKEELENL